MGNLGRCALPLTFVMAAACSEPSGGQEAAAVRDSADVRIVDNHGSDLRSDASVVHLTDLEPPDSSLTPVPWGVAADPKTGRIFAVDWTAPRLVVFDREGAFLREVGREGSGPGEFLNPVALALDDDGNVAVWDAGRSMISRWSLDGSLLGEERAPIDYWGPGFGISAEELLTVTSEQVASGMEMVQRLVGSSAGDTRTVHELPIELVMMELPGIRTPAPRVFSPSIVWTSRGDDVYVLNGPGYRIDRYSGGGLTASYRREVTPIRATEAMAVASVEKAPGPYRGFLRRFAITPDQLVRAVGHERLVSPVQNLAIDGAGRLWVTRTMDGVLPSVTDILADDGLYLGTLDVPGLPATFLAGSRVVVLRLEESGRTVLGLYRVDGLATSSE